MIPAAPTISDRLLAAFRALIRTEDPNRTFRGIYEYAVQAVSSDGTTADASPTDTTLGLPSQVKIPLRLCSMTAKLTVGSKCLVFWINGDPTRMSVLSSDPVPQNAVLDASTELDLGPSAGTVNVAAGTLAAARQTDTVVAGIFAGTITSGSTKVKVG